MQSLQDSYNGMACYAFLSMAKKGLEIEKWGSAAHRVPIIAGRIVTATLISARDYPEIEI